MWKKKFGKNSKLISKDAKVMISNFDAASKLLNNKKYSKNSIKDKLDLYFVDIEFVPLLVQENYLNTYGDSKNYDTLQKMAAASEMISYSDVLNIKIR